MCGIAGWYDLQNAIEEDTLHAMLDTLKRRGPDDNGIYQEDHLALLHARLSIMDPEKGMQPMYFKQYVIVYNGELYNTKEVRSYLEKQGYEFETTCDTEVLLKAFAFEQECCLERFNGIFAFAIWNKETQTLFMARDRLGVKPLFYHFDENGLIFGSEIKTLLAHPYVKAEMTNDGLKELFLLGPARTSGKTPIRDIKELRAGEYAYYNDGHFKIETYWKLKAKKHTESIEESVEHLHQLVNDCVRDQLDSDVGLCCFLSGGLDSSIISMLAAKKYPDLETFSIEYEENDKYFKKSLFQPERDADYIETMVNAIHSRHTACVFSQQEIVDALLPATKARDLPGMAEVDSSLLLFCEQIKKYKSVALSGEGADEILGGYPWYYNEDILWKDEFPWSSSDDLRVFCLRDGLIHEGREYVEKAYYHTLCDVDVLAEDTPRERRMREMFILNLRWFLMTLLDRKDRMSMYCGLEVRVPFLDYRLVEYCYNLPWEMKSLNGREKGILREAFKDELPKKIIERKKSPYPKTHHPLYTSLLVEKIRLILKEDCLLAKLLDKDKVEMIIKNLEEVKVPWYGQLMQGPQMLAYFIQLHYFFETYHIQYIE